MPRSHLGVLASLALASVLIFSAPGCSDDGRTASKAGFDGGVDAPSRHVDAAAPPDGNAGSGFGGAPGEHHDGSTPGGGGGGGGGAEPPGGAAGAGGAAPTGADAGCDPLDVPDAAVERELTLCTRLRSASVLAFDVTRAYDHAVYADCRVAWVIDLYLQVDMRADFLNALLAWNMQFWGCTAPPPTDFALIFKPAPLSTGDVTALIDDYVSVVTPSLDLSDLEIADMRAALVALAQPLIADPSCRLSRSSCDTTGAGGTGSGGAMGSGGAANGGAMAMGSGGDTTAGDAGSARVPDGGPRFDTGAGGRDAASIP